MEMSAVREAEQTLGEMTFVPSLVHDNTYQSESVRPKKRRADTEVVAVKKARVEPELTDEDDGEITVKQKLTNVQRKHHVPTRQLLRSGKWYANSDAPWQRTLEWVPKANNSKKVVTSHNAATAFEVRSTRKCFRSHHPKK